MKIASDAFEYLVYFPELATIVFEAVGVLRKEFPKPDEITVEMYHDPESNDYYLQACIRQKEYQDDIMERIEKVSKLFEERLDESKGWFLITTNFQPPRSGG